MLGQNCVCTYAPTTAYMRIYATHFGLSLLFPLLVLYGNCFFFFFQTQLICFCFLLIVAGIHSCFYFFSLSEFCKKKINIV